MAGLTAIFTAEDNITAQLESMAEAGQKLAETFSDAQEATNSAFANIESGASSSVSSVDGIATSVGSLQNISDEASASTDTLAETLESYGDAANDAASQTDYWTEAVGNYDKGALEAVYTTEELVEMGFKSADALGDMASASEEAGNAASKLAKSTDDLGSSTENLSENLEDTGQKGVNSVELMSSALIAAGLKDKIVEITTAVYEFASAFSDAESTVVKATGASGEALAGLDQSMMDAFSSSKSASLDATAGAIGEINTRMGLTGDTLTTVTGQFLDFAEITGTNVVGSVQNVTKIMNKWGVESGEVESVLDKLAYAGQISGISVDSLSNTVINSSATFQALGLDLDNAISFLAQLELYGTNSQTAVMGLRTAVNNFSRSGEDAETALRNVINEIATMEDTTEATALAVQTFGSRAGQELAGAIRNGTVSVETLSQSLDVAQGTLSSTADTAQTMSQKWTQASNNIKSAFASALQPVVEGLSNAFAEIANKIGDFLNEHPQLTQALTIIGIAMGVALGATIAYSVATAVATPIVEAFGTAVQTAFWPITLVALAIGGAIAAFAALKTAVEEAEGETKDMTSTTREQYYELQNLTDEYERACESGEKTTEELASMKNELDDLTAEFEANRQTMEEYTAEVDSLCESAANVESAYRDATKEIQQQEIHMVGLVQRYEELSKKTNPTTAETQLLASATEELNAAYPELNRLLQEGLLTQEQYTAAIRDQIEADAELARIEEQRNTYNKAQDQIDALELEKAKTEALIAAEQERLDNMSDAEKWARWMIGEDVYEDLNTYTDALDQLNVQEQGLINLQGELEASMNGTGDAALQAGEDTRTAAEIASEGVSVAYESQKEALDNLCAEYEEAYNAALSSFEGQFGLFDEAKANMDATVESAQAALNSQLAYWESYGSNIEYLQNNLLTTAGLTEAQYNAVMSAVQDGSEEAAGLAANIVEAVKSGDEETVQNLANTMVNISDTQQNVAEMTADFATDFSNRLDEIENDMKNTIQELNLGPEASAAANATITQYAEQIRAGKTAAVNAAKEVADAVSAALVTKGSGGGSSSAQANANGTTYSESRFIAGEKGPELVARSAAQYAGGTTDSTDFFIAGENGPELIVGEPGSTVFPASETDRLIESLNEKQKQPLNIYAETGGEEKGSSEQNKNINININGNGSIGVEKGADKSSVLEILTENIKPVLMGMLQTEIYEEGDLSYDY